MAVDLDRALGGILEEGVELTLDELEVRLRESTEAASGDVESTFEEAGWYGNTAQPYAPPAVPFDAPRPAKPQVIQVDRRLWLARYNPADPDFDVSDIADDAKFPWQHPEAATREGWWVSTKNTPAGRPAIEEIATGDLVICQRTDPVRRGDGMLVGICVIGMTDSWNDIDTGEREHQVCLVPLVKFTYPVPRRVALRHGRLRVKSMSSGQQLPGRQGPLGFGLSYVEWEDAVELLSVCGIPPIAVAEPDTARLAARLRTSDTGNRLFFRLRYDARIVDRVRRMHERDAERRAEAWARAKGYVKRAGYQHVANAGFDLLFVDAAGAELQVEVKGYMATKLAAVHLQPSQAWRAHDAAGGIPPPWRLFALLGAGSKRPTEHVVTPDQAVALIAANGLQVKGGWPAARPVAQRPTLTKKSPRWRLSSRPRP